MSSPPRPTARKQIRLAVRALILHEDRLLLVNAWPDGMSDLWCAPGGGVDPGQSLPETLMREVFEETGLSVTVGAPALINEFHDPKSGFHQVEVFFHARLPDSHAQRLDPAWQDPEGIVTTRRFFSREDLALGRARFKPDSLPTAAWGDGLFYDPLEVIVT
jgi:8-oxo-dGTP pyrophosphatase MutT (NUDIX family)